MSIDANDPASPASSSHPDGPLVSVCIPAYKAERYLLETLDSVAAQTHRNWELIVIEDGSRDGTEALVSAFAKRVPQHVRFERHPANRGLSATRNTGFSRARGEYVAILDADDVWLPGHLAESLRVLADTTVSLSFSACQNFDSDTGRELETRALDPVAIGDLPLSLLQGRLVVQPSTVVFRRSLLDGGLGFDPAYPICNDLDFWLKCARAGARFGATRRVTCRYRKHAGGLSRNAAALAAEVASLQRRYRDWPGLPAGPRKKASLKVHVAAARMIARTRPLAAARLFLLGLSDILRPRR